MSWLKIDDQFPNHPKVVEAGPLAGWLFICGLGYAGQYLTDGFIPEKQVRRLADVESPDQLADKLCEVGLWERVKDGYQIHGYLEYNPSAERVKADREAAKQRMARQRSGEHSSLYNGSSEEVQANFVRSSTSPSPSPIPYPINPNPDTLEGGAPTPPAQSKKGKPAQTSIPDGYAPTAKMIADAEKKYPDMDVPAASDRWIGSMKANKSKYRRTDWNQAWWNGMDQAEDGGWHRLRQAGNTDRGRGSPYAPPLDASKYQEGGQYGHLFTPPKKQAG